MGEVDNPGTRGRSGEWEGKRRRREAWIKGKEVGRGRKRVEKPKAGVGERGWALRGIGGEIWRTQ